ncbi:MAG: tetratricopeptide repeat protein, partial [Marinobacter sp.]
AGSVLEQHPGHSVAVILLGHERHEAGRADDAIAFVELGLQRDSSNIGLGLLKIELLEGVGNLKLARESFLSLIQRNPKADKLYPLLARFHMRRGRLADAEDALRARVNLVPHSSEAKVGLIRFLYAAGRAERAIEELQAFVQEGDHGVELTFLLARLYQEKGSYGKQVIILKTLAADQAGKPWALLATAQLAAFDLRQGDTKSAGLRVKAILEMERDNVEGLFLRALIALSEKRHEDAIVDLRIIALYGPDLPPVLAALANAHALSGSMQLAQSHYQRAFQASGMDPDYGLAYARFFIRQDAFAQAESIIVKTLQSAPRDRAVLEQLAGLLIMRKDWTGAQSAIHSLAQTEATAVSPGLEKYIGAMARSSDGITDATDVAQSLIALHDLATQSGQSAPALDLLETALASEPDNYGAVLLVGQLRMLQGRVVEAREIFKGMIARDPDGAEAYLNLSRLFLRESRLRDAAHVLAKGLVRRPLDPVLLLGHAEVSERAGNKEEAIRAYEMLIETGHDPQYVSNNLASLLTDNRTDLADFERAYELVRGLDHDRNPYFRDTLGWANYRLGRYADAVELLEATIEESPSVAVFHYHLGMSYLALDNQILAKQALNTALALGAKAPFTEASATKTALRQIIAREEGE